MHCKYLLKQLMLDWAGKGFRFESVSKYLLADVEVNYLIKWTRPKFPAEKRCLVSFKHKMVLAELGSKITRAISNLQRQTVIDDSVVDEMLKEIGNALVASDVNVQLVLKLRKNIKAAINLTELAAGLNKRKIIQKVYSYLYSSSNSPFPTRW